MYFGLMMRIFHFSLSTVLKLNRISNPAENLELPKKAKEIGNDREQENPIINPKEAQHKESDSIQASTSIKQKIPESSIKTLTDMGVDRNEAIHALEMTDGDIELALGIIYS
jgi:NACalpha-BTF3-like transcription factor